MRRMKVNAMSLGPNDFLWSTRGLAWGFRILHHPPGDRDAWLAVYETAFRNSSGSGECFARAVLDTPRSRAEPCAALRFPDPESRRDQAGRVIPHEFVILGDAAAGVSSWEEGQARLWPLVAQGYSAIYGASTPPGDGAFRFQPDSSQDGTNRGTAD